MAQAEPVGGSGDGTIRTATDRIASGERVDRAWFLNYQQDLGEAAVAEYLADGVWVSSSPEAHAQALSEMRPNDRVVLKKIRVLRQGVGFFNADLPVSSMTLLATGTIRDIDAKQGKVEISWDAGRPARVWLFFTGISAVWKVDRGGHPHAAALLDFTFQDVDQDLAAFLERPFWRSRYPSQPSFDWIPFLEEVATKLLDYRHDRSQLLEWIHGSIDREPHLNYLSKDLTAEGEEVPLDDIDPFTVMGIFNRSLTWENRRHLAALVADNLGVTAPVPDSFDALPTLNNQRSWFFAYAHTRQPGDIDTLWDVFAEALSLADGGGREDRTAFVRAYDRAREIYGVSWNLTQGLFWVRPRDFVPLDGQTRAYLKQRWEIRPPQDGDAYLKLVDQLKEQFAGPATSLNSFADLSHAAFTRLRSPVAGSDVATLARWGQLIAEVVDLDATENDYKRKTARLMQEARLAAVRRDPTWPTTFRSALNAAYNLLHYIFKSRVAAAVDAEPDAWAEVFSILWDDPTPESFNLFKEALEDRLGHVTDGNATGLGALLCMGVDAEGNAPYLTSRTDLWRELTGFEGGVACGRTPADRYAQLLRFLDALREEVRSESRVILSRLEAQSLAWAATELCVPDDVWDQPLRGALQAWRSGGGSHRYRHVWIVRPRSDVAETWLHMEHVALIGSGLDALAGETDRAAIERRIEKANPQRFSTDREDLAAASHAFVGGIQVDDLVIVPTDLGLQVGRVCGPAQPHTDPPGLAREVEWLGRVPDDAVLPVEVAAALDQQGTVIDLGEVADMIEGLASPTEPPGQPASAAATETPAALLLPTVTAEVASRLHMEVGPLQEIVDLLAARRQLILYGPPGTGKTFVAQHLGRHIVGTASQSHLQLVQFHPSYAYEDFFEGYRPALTEEGQATFALTPGPLARIAAEARANPGMPFVLVIDEINRANLAKVFGELYFLLEYRDQTIRLQYRPQEAFRLPPNLFIIGTMNTADRSIAMIDAAMRRRFAFIELHPQEEPVRGVLERVVGGSKDERPRLLDLLNAAIGEEDRDIHIGPTYLMRPEAQTEEGLHQIWRFDILPLLEEYYYARKPRDEVRRLFGLEVLLERIRSSRVPEEPEEPAGRQGE